MLHNGDFELNPVNGAGTESIQPTPDNNIFWIPKPDPNDHLGYGPAITRNDPNGVNFYPSKHGEIYCSIHYLAGTPIPDGQPSASIEQRVTLDGNSTYRLEFMMATYPTTSNRPDYTGSVKVELVGPTTQTDTRTLGKNQDWQSVAPINYKTTVSGDYILRFTAPRDATTVAFVDNIKLCKQ